MENRKKVNDPVCHMNVETGKLEFEYQGMLFSFCSQQCRDRFEKNPHLYIGTAGKPAPKQQGKNIVKQRRIKLDKTVSEETAKNINFALRKMMGIKDVTINDDTIYITYDLLEATEHQIEESIRQSGELLGTQLSELLKRAFINYLEEAELDNLERQGSTHGHHHN